MGKRSRAEFLASNLPQLQNLIKRDPGSYREEFSQQWRHYESALAIFTLKPDSEADSFGELITFISHVAPCYPKECAPFPQHIIDLLSTHHQILQPELRKTMVQALVLLRNRDMISTTSLLSLFFTLFRCKDKALRQLLHNHIVNDIKAANVKAKNNKLNKTLQNFMYTMLKDTNEIAAKKSLEVMIDLYKKNVWNDAKTVNIISEACFSPIPKIIAPALHFFLGTNDQKEEDEDNDDVPDMAQLKHAHQINKKSKGRKSALDKAMATVKRKERQKNRAETFNFSALHLLNDPQGFAEKLFSRLKQATSSNLFPFPLRLTLLNLVSRLIGVHKLLLLNFYDFLIPFLKPHQRDVTQILAYAAQASHDLVPPDVLSPVVRAIADNFVWSNASAEVVTAGLNGLREVVSRCPLAMEEELLKSLLEDFKNHREKGPMNAARSLLGLYREVNPEMLRKKDRGKAATINLKDFKAAKYGEVRVAEGVEGAELLEANSDDEGQAEGEDGWDGWEVDSDADLGSGEEAEASDASWEDISDDGEEGDEVVEEVEGDEGADEQEGEVEEDEEDEEEGDEEEIDASDESPEGEDEEAAPSPPKKKKIGFGLAAEKIFTEEDFARIRELRQERDAERMAGVKRSNMELAADSDDEEEEAGENVVDVSRITAGIKRKDDYEARVDSIKAGREGRKYGSKKGTEERASMTNKEKSKKTKAFMMMVHKKSVKGKAKRSLREKQKVLRQHVRKQKMKRK
ncbi:Protein SDA1 [Rhizophlyctis rosea]|nr:Protein SDA1 [Rhizophlyctis rosea]